MYIILNLNILKYNLVVLTIKCIIMYNDVSLLLNLFYYINLIYCVGVLQLKQRRILIFSFIKIDSVF